MTEQEQVTEQGQVRANLEYVFEMRVNFRPERCTFGPLPGGGSQGYTPCADGTIYGPRLTGRVVPDSGADYADVRGDGSITRELADRALAMLDVDPQGFDIMDRKLLEAVVHRFDGGPVGLDNIAASIGEEAGTIEDVIEPYLIQQGFLQRTPRGRMATQAAYRHLGLPVPGDDAS